MFLKHSWNYPVDDWKIVSSDPSILYENYVKVDQSVAVCGKSTYKNIIIQLSVNNELSLYYLWM